MPKKRKNITQVRVQRLENKPVVPNVTVEPEIDDDEPCDDDGLNPRRRMFVAAMVGPARGNATKAAEIAGYKSDNRVALRKQGSRLLTFVAVQQGISRGLARKCMTADWVRESIAEVANSNMANFVSVDENGVETTDFRKAASAGALSQIKEIKQKIIKSGGSDDQQVIECTIKVHDRMPALALMARMHGLIKDNPDAGDGTKRIGTDSPLATAEVPYGAEPPVEAPLQIQDGSSGKA